MNLHVKITKESVCPDGLWDEEENGLTCDTDLRPYHTSDRSPPHPTTETQTLFSDWLMLWICSLWRTCINESVPTSSLGVSSNFLPRSQFQHPPWESVPTPRESVSTSSLGVSSIFLPGSQFQLPSWESVPTPSLGVSSNSLGISSNSLGVTSESMGVSSNFFPGSQNQPPPGSQLSL
ncbi:unnamed protein product [Nesidiocoris tenuis]|uniref:Uncharacterized protein n=1 Tax=Nesidiocoris tenuis TaxID=355587 RepID=A0A6H5H7L9_9HEMI|nr:unnamed protein product [Nesidiocoris tenuis]CAB0012329.1 unnamed protein product [Nesidiocoris tenuis]